MADYYITTKEVQQKLFKGNLTAAEWKVYSYFSMIDPYGDNYREIPDTLTILRETGIGKTTYYKAIARLQELELLDFQIGSAHVRRFAGLKSKDTDSSNSTNSVTSSENGTGSSENGTQSSENGTQVPNTGTQSQIPENRTPKPRQRKDFTTPKTNKTNKDIKNTTECDRRKKTNEPVKRSDRNQEESRGSVIEVFEKYKEQLQRHGVYLMTYQNDILQLNPKIEPVIQQAGCLPTGKVEPAIKSFIAWIKEARDVKEPYRAFFKAIKERWEES